MASIRRLSGIKREHAILSAFRAELHPSWLFTWQQVRVTAGPHIIDYFVTPSYLAVGDDYDWIRIPMMPLTAQLIADAKGASLPTRKMVNDIYRACKVRLPQVSISTNRSASITYELHNEEIETRRGQNPVGPLAGGEKKDVVLSNLLVSRPRSVAIYGWHGLRGKYTQPLYAGHGSFYVDYSHGVRLVRRDVAVDGAPRDLLDVFSDPALYVLVQDDSPLRFLRYPTDGA